MRFLFECWLPSLCDLAENILIFCATVQIIFKQGRWNFSFKCPRDREDCCLWKRLTWSYHWFLWRCKCSFLFFKLFVVKQGLECLWSLRPWVVTHSWGQFANDCVLFDLTASPPLSFFHPKNASGREIHGETGLWKGCLSSQQSHCAHQSQPSGTGDTHQKSLL